MIATRVVLGALVVASLAVAAGPLTGRYRTLTVVSGSMEPTLPVGSVLLYTPIDASSVEVGDIITFHPPGQQDLMTHRVIEATPRPNGVAVVTKGDANTSSDPWRLQLVDTTVWKVRTHVPAIGYLLVWLRGTPLMRMAIYALPILLGIVWLVRIWSNDDEASEARDAALA